MKLCKKCNSVQVKTKGSLYCLDCASFLQCKFCNKIIGNGLKLAAHIKWCANNPNHAKYKVKKEKRKEPFKHSKETREVMRRKRIEFLKNNPDKHSWSRKSTKKYTPEDNFETVLNNFKVNAVRYYRDTSWDRFFELDFAIPENKIAFEINGNQHYNFDGTLKEYYQIRHDYLVNHGWTVHEIHYSECYDNTKIAKILNNCKLEYASDSVIINQRLSKKAIKILQKGLRMLCNPVDKKLRPSQKGKLRHNSRKVARPSKSELSKMLWEKPTQHIAKYFGVSDTAIAKWAKIYGIEKPPRGYWAKKVVGKV